MIDNEIEIRSAVYQRSSNTAERISTSLSTTTVSLTLPPPSFDGSDFASSVMVDKLASGSQWALSLLGKSFCFKELELEDDPAFRDRHPSNTFIINTIVSYDPIRKVFVPASVRCSNRSLHYVFYSVDVTNEYEISPISSFAPNLPHNRRFYLMKEGLGNQVAPSPPDVEEFPFMQGVNDEMAIVELSPAQMGVLLTFAPPSSSYVLDPYALNKFRKAMSAVIKVLVQENSDVRKNQLSNILMSLPYMFLQYEGNRSDKQKCDFFDQKLMSGDYASIKIGHFKKKSIRTKHYLDRNFDFSSRCQRLADKCAIAGDYGKAMQSLQRMDLKINLDNVSVDIEASLPPRNLREISLDLRRRTFRHTDATAAVELITEDNVLKQLKKLKKNRSPGVDGFTVEHLISIFLGGNRNVQLRDDLLQNYVLFLKQFVAGQLTQHQLKLFHAIKLSAIPKDDVESRVIMMFGVHSKLVFSIFASSKLKKNMEKRIFKHQYGTKKAGAETMIHSFQQVLVQNPDYDIFSADAIKAFYNLNRDLAMKRFKEECPEFFNLFMDKYNNSADAFFLGLVQGVKRFVQSEGGSPGAPEMSFLYELGVNEFVQNVADLLHKPDYMAPKGGLICGYIDDLYWAATFFKMVKVIEFVIERGPAFGYTLNMKKCTYLMAPTVNALTDEELDQRLAVLTALGLPLENIKIHPDCQPESPPEVLAKRRVEWGFKILGAFVGTDEYVLASLRPKMEGLRNLSQTLLRYPNVQARYFLHKTCFNAKINYWMRAQYPAHTTPFVNDFKELQMKLLASYHGIYDDNDFNRSRDQIAELYERAALPIEKGGMGLRNISLISLTAFPCSLAVSLKDLAKSFPNWIVLGREGSLLRISENESPNLAAQVLNSIDQYRMLVPEGFFREGDDLSAIMKTIESIDERRNANHRPSQLRREPVPLAWKKTSQAALYAQLIGVEFERLIEVSKAQASAVRDHNDLARVSYRNWISTINENSGAWLSMGLSPKLFQMSNNEFVSALCRRNTVEDPMVPKQATITSREESNCFSCRCDGGTRPKSIDPFGYHLVGCKTGANAIRLHDEVVSLLARLFRCLRVDAIVEPIRIFADLSEGGNNQRPDILLRNPRGFGRQVIIDVAITGIDGQSRTSDDFPDRPLRVRHEQKKAKYGPTADRYNLQFVPAIFSHTGQIHAPFKSFVMEQIRHKLITFEGKAKPSRVKAVMKWWTKCISMVIAKTASRNVAFKSDKIMDALFQGQSGAQTPQSVFDADFEILASNSEVYIFDQDDSQE